MPHARFLKCSIKVKSPRFHEDSLSLVLSTAYYFPAATFSLTSARRNSFSVRS